MSEPNPPRPARPPQRALQPASTEAVDALRARVTAATGCELVAGPCGIDTRLPTSADALRDGFVAPLTDLAVLSVSGPEAAAFLHAQLTNDVEHLPADTARIAGYCSPKGRLLGTFTCWRQADAVCLLGAQPSAATLAARLSLYVLRAKAVVRDASADLVLLGAAGARGEQALAALGLEPPPPLSVRSVATATDGADADPTAATTVVGLPAVTTSWGEQSRWIVAVPVDQLAGTWAALAACAPAGGSEAWRWLEVLSGTPRIVGGAVEQFVPQMINFEVTGGVDFRKGCYPGQEIVARSQYLGRLKRRMFLGHVDASAPVPGAEVRAEASIEPVGQVVLGAPDPAGGAVVLFEAPLDRVQAGGARLSIDGAPVALRELPYTLPT